MGLRGPKPVSPLKRAWKWVHCTDTCWLWFGCKAYNGYGWIGVSNDKHIHVHRLFYTSYIGPIPKGLEIDHICRRRNCVNPDHLRAVTHAENMKNLKLLCAHGHEYSYTKKTERAYERICRTCNNRRQRQYKRRQHEQRATSQQS